MITGTKAAVGLGAATGLLLLVGVGILIRFMLHRRRVRSISAEPAETSQSQSNLIPNTGELSGYPKLPYELHGEVGKRSELSDRPL